MHGLLDGNMRTVYKMYTAYSPHVYIGNVNFIYRNFLAQVWTPCKSRSMYNNIHVYCFDFYLKVHFKAILTKICEGFIKSELHYD